MLVVLKTSTPLPARPFIKWLGGKNRLLTQLSRFLPPEYSFKQYYEPFMGGGAMFFYLEPRAAILNDLNPHLINLYVQTRNNLPQLEKKLKLIEEEYLGIDHDARKDYYYNKRTKFNSHVGDDAESAALFLFLNKTCFNGVYRENPQGEFNVPFGRNNFTELFDIKSIEKASVALQNASLYSGSYESILSNAGSEDFIYFDPPYVPQTRTAKFTQYTGTDFGQKEHEHLRDIFIELDKRGCYVMLSNSDTPIVRHLYRDYAHNHHEILANRSVNCKAQGRGKITELVITNY